MRKRRSPAEAHIIHRPIDAAVALHHRRVTIPKIIRGQRHRLGPRLAPIATAQDVDDAVLDAPLLAPLLPRHHRHHGDQAAIVEPHAAGAFDIVFGIRIVEDDRVILRQRGGRQQRNRPIVSTTESRSARGFVGGRYS